MDVPDTSSFISKQRSEQKEYFSRETKNSAGNSCRNLINGAVVLPLEEIKVRSVESGKLQFRYWRNWRRRLHSSVLTDGENFTAAAKVGDFRNFLGRSRV